MDILTLYIFVVKVTVYDYKINFLQINYLRSSTHIYS